jgi:3-deoxy-manno-octulosonate cytidylyltransferase (CMP-KDO synthetase)
MFHVIIPARYDSVRFPGKLLALLAGKPLLQHTYEAACQSGAQSVSIATDDQRIAEAAKGFGAPVVVTRADHPNGTQRLAEAAQILQLPDPTVVVNLQGDEPMMSPANIRQAAQALITHAAADVATLYQPFEKVADLFNPDCVKVVFADDGKALYFSRAPIPWDRQQFANGQQTQAMLSEYHHHLGIYVYRVALLKEYASLPVSQLGSIERLEQLRLLVAGKYIHLSPAVNPIPVGVDNPANLQALVNYLDNKHN